MKVLQVNGYESPGRRFHGLSLTPLLKKYGIESRHLVWQKDTQNPEVLTFEGKRTKKYHKIATYLENRFSLQSILHPHALQIKKMAAFQEADVVHLHIIHSGYFSLWALPIITRLKPTVWTLHDPWAMTGHCIHPFDCKRWKTGCGKCPNLSADFPLKRDTTRFLFNYKRVCYQNSRFDVIVASTWMKEMVESSPLFKGVNIHHVPFGLNLNFFSPEATLMARQRFGISENTLVICFRALNNTFKGMPYIIEALDRLNINQKICLLTLNDCKLFDRFVDRFQVIPLEWTNDEFLVRDAIAACDIFLMPSLAEAFGMMAVEALACKKPIIVFEGTALPAVTFAPEIGIAVPMDVQALAEALQHLIDDPQERLRRGEKGREVAERYYSDELQAKRLSDIYFHVAR